MPSGVVTLGSSVHGLPKHKLALRSTASIHISHPDGDYSVSELSSFVKSLRPREVWVSRGSGFHLSVRLQQDTSEVSILSLQRDFIRYLGSSLRHAEVLHASL